MSIQDEHVDWHAKVTQTWQRKCIKWQKKIIRHVCVCVCGCRNVFHNVCDLLGTIVHQHVLYTCMYRKHWLGRKRAMGPFTLEDKKRNFIRVLNGQNDMISNLSRPRQKINVHITITESRFLCKTLFISNGWDRYMSFYNMKEPA